ncbi:Uncharacterized conserved protein YbjT, contains NAD(P)-binding and DUF2867 domains [Pseudoxanthomonas sp. GM95]|uniref:SDR family oxidoreductase n=1 Tax=Pseudoxanthomonas sp. GM95 TaxID=1881043 RepID=UPI0008AEB397|nr:NmrA family transcriptional regulator [Pseudoxanthomonas sp. GM95]SEL12173.1 Uncharacterized conserved protein YbjT, contains NAD(P)-binding and DUF2867 domains [Pseudoxanthomonas sp. GM95]
MDNKRVVLIGDSGVIGNFLSERLTASGWKIVRLGDIDVSQNKALEKLKAALQRSDVVIDLTTPPSYESKVCREYLVTMTRRLLKEEVGAKISHHILLSTVGADRLPGNGYFEAKAAQEAVVEAASVPFSIIRSTPLFDVIPGIANASGSSGNIKVSTAMFQPIASEDVALALADAASGRPMYGCVDLAGPERAPFDEFMRRYLAILGDQRCVEADPKATYFGGRTSQMSLVPVRSARIGRTSLSAWCESTAVH